jgi:Fibronectin type III-like domain
MTVNVSVSLSNTASRGGLFVVEVYFSQQLSRYARFQRMLAGFVKVVVPANGEANATVSVSFADMAHFDPIAKTMFLESGTYTFFVCTSSDAASCAKANTHDVVIPQTYTGL